jgi:hypothetical protein
MSVFVPPASEAELCLLITASCWIHPFCPLAPVMPSNTTRVEPAVISQGMLGVSRGFSLPLASALGGPEVFPVHKNEWFVSQKSLLQHLPNFFTIR